MAFGNLTVDFRQLSKIPVRDRVTLAQSPQASSIFGNMSPTEIAALFPDYYKKFMPTGGGGGASMSSGMTGAGYTGSGSAPTTSGATPASTGPTRPALIQEILNSAGPMPGQGGKKSGTEGLKGRQQMMKMVYDGYVSAGFSHKQALAFTAEVGRENGYNASLIFGTHTDLNGHTNAGMISMQKDRRVNLFSYLQSQGLIDENGKMIQNQDTINAQARFQMMEIKENYPKTAEKFLGNPDISMEDAAVILGDDYIRWARKGNPRIGFSAADAARHAEGRDRYYYEIQKITEEFSTIEQSLPGTAPIDQTAPADETGIIPLEQGGTAAVVPQTQAFDPAILTQLDPRIQEYYKTATDAEKRQLENAITKLGTSSIQKITSEHPTSTATAVTDKLYQESVKNFTEASSAANFYDNVRGQYPDKIDVNSPIWDMVDPELAKARKLLVDADTGLVGRDALLAADSSAKVMRNNNYIPRIASGGDNHSANHGSGRDANYSIDLAASVVDKNGKVVPVQLGKDMPEKIKNDMASAAYFASMDAVGGHRVGYPDSSSPHSMHIQQDPARRTAYWGYSETAKRMGVGTSSIATLQATDEGKRFLAERETINRLTPEQKAEYFDTITGYKTQKIESSTANVAQTTHTQSLPGTAPQTQGAPTSETDVQPLQQANTNMALGGTKSLDVEPNMVNEKYTIAQTDPKTGQTKPIANFNKEEEVNIKDGQMNVESTYKKKSQETMQKTDTGTPKTNQYNMRQSTDRQNDELGRQIRDGIVPDSPSFRRSVHHSRFGVEHFNRGAKSQYS